MGIRVRALGIGVAEGEKKAVGFYGHKRRYPGEVFEIEGEEEFSAKWMEYVDGAVSSDSESPSEPKGKGKRKGKDVEEQD